MSSLLSQLSPAQGGKKIKKRLGRGKGSGKGGTSGKGHKGQRARSGVSIPPGFEGGTMPLSRRVPKFGFTSRAEKPDYEVINLSRLSKWEGEITPETLAKKGLVTGRKKVKILGNGEVKKVLAVKAHRFSKKAKELIEKAGGRTETL